PRATESRELHESILHALSALPGPQREAATLYYINGYSQKEIAEFLEVPPGRVKSRLASARRRLRKEMVTMVADELNAAKPGKEFAAQLFNGINLDKWVILSESPRYEIAGGELVVDGPLHAEVGGMSWDDYRVGVDVRVERDASDRSRFPFNVQLCPVGTCVYAQLFGDNVNLAYWDNEREPHFTHLASEPRPVPRRRWHRFEVLAEGGVAAVFLDGEEVIRERVPRGTAGMLGLLVNADSDARVRLRNIRITFLKPTPEQLRELETPAATNWEDFKRRQVAAGRRESVEDNTL
ncbi:MAG TPA: sigma-70 family RNA polymerase sigma factor, partial [Phycisphaerae bacterium]|nr:sigma-70 family RNA polymerase sigma factor [Phycisphaerae bacterium]